MAEMFSLPCDGDGVKTFDANAMCDGGKLAHEFIYVPPMMGDSRSKCGFSISITLYCGITKSESCLNNKLCTGLDLNEIFPMLMLFCHFKTEHNKQTHHVQWV